MALDKAARYIRFCNKEVSLCAKLHVCVCVCVCTVKSVEGSRTRGKLLSEVISTAGPEAQ